MPSCMKCGKEYSKDSTGHLDKDCYSIIVCKHCGHEEMDEHTEKMIINEWDRKNRTEQDKNG